MKPLRCQDLICLIFYKGAFYVRQPLKEKETVYLIHREHKYHRSEQGKLVLLVFYNCGNVMDSFVQRSIKSELLDPLIFSVMTSQLFSMVVRDSERLRTVF